MNKISALQIIFGTLLVSSFTHAECGPVPPGSQQDTSCNITSHVPPTIGEDLVAEGAVESVACEKAKKKNGTHHAILKIEKIKAGPRVDKVDFLFDANKGPTVLSGDKGIYTLKKKKSVWILTSVEGSLFSSSILPSCK